MLHLITLFLAGCGETIFQPDTQEPLYGKWNLTDNNKGVALMVKASGLSECYGFTINPDGKFVEHKNAGWCGTPPILY